MAQKTDMDTVFDSTVAAQVIQRATQLGLTIATAESCTGGLVGGVLTSSPGASAVYLGGFITYANEAKVALADVSPQTLDMYGAVSSQVAEEMACGCRKRLECDIALSVTGIAGPGGGTEEKPVGTVWLGVSTTSGTKTHLYAFKDGAREGIRSAAVRAALDLIMATIQNVSGFM